MATDLDERPKEEGGEIVVSGKVVVVVDLVDDENTNVNVGANGDDDCNGNSNGNVVVVDEEIEEEDMNAKENGDASSYVLVENPDVVSDDKEKSESDMNLPSQEVEEKRIDDQVVELEETKHDADADVNSEEGSKCEIVDKNNYGAIEKQDEDKLGSEEVEVVVEEIREESVGEGAGGFVVSELNQPDHEEEEKVVEEETQLPQVVKAVESDSKVVEEEEKVEDQAKLDCESASKEILELEPQTEEVTDEAVESELHQPDGENQVEEISKVAAESEEAAPVVEAAESEPLQVDNKEDIDEQIKLLESPVEVCQDTQEAVEAELSRPDDKKECETGPLADEVPMDDPSIHVETENLKSETVSCPSDAVQLEKEASDEIGGMITCPAEQTVVETEKKNGSDEEIESEAPKVNGHVENTELSSSSVELKSETAVEDVSTANGEGLSADPVASGDLESEVVEVSVARDESMSSCSVAAHDLETKTGATNGFPGSTDLPAADSVDDVQSESEGGNSSSASKKELPTTGTVKLESLVSNGPVLNGDSKPECVNDVKSIENEGDQSVCGDINGSVELIDSNGSLSPSPEVSTVGALEGKVEKGPLFRYLIRIPRYIDDKIKNQIELAQKQVDERTRDRDEIRSTIQSRRGTSGEYRDKFEVARSEERAARDALSAKRREMDSVQSVINRMKNATSIEDIDDRIRNMEHRISHETVPLKEEKQVIREIKQLKNLREQLSSSLAQQSELQPTSDERVKIEERFKLLKQEMESCRKEVMRLEGIAQAAWKINSDENEKLKELQAKFRAADDLRQDAYTQLHNLKKQLYDKNKPFRMYKEDGMKAEDYSRTGDKEALQHLCLDQVESIMELWNTNNEFQNEYIRCNTNSTLRRLGTLDGRALGPEEESPLLRKVLDARADNSVLTSANKIDFPLLSPSGRGKPVGQDVGSAVNLEQKNPKSDSKSVVKLEQKYPTVKSKTITKPIGLENSSVTVSVKEDIQENSEEKKRAIQEEELARKAEELRKEEEEAKLKEQRRLKEKAKAKEAEERKRRNAEKAQARAELRAQKEAEFKEKEREKKARKKERKKEMVEAATGGSEAESASRSESTLPEITQEPETKENPKAIVKRSLKPSVLAKQTKPKVVPPPLRNRSKKRQQWMWILLVAVVIIALFLVGNIGFSFKYGLPSFGF